MALQLWQVSMDHAPRCSGAMYSVWPQAAAGGAAKGDCASSNLQVLSQCHQG